MKPPPFEYFAPRTRREVLDLLAEDPDETKILAGGQSLVPMMNFRLARPERLVDINHVPGLEHVEQHDDRLVIGARVTHLTLQNRAGGSPLDGLLRMAAAQIGHLPIRTRGTFGGSLAHCDAASEWCLLARLLDATVTVESREARRSITAADFFQTIFTTAMEPTELLIEASFERLDEHHQTGFAEFARRAGDFAIVAVTTDVRVDNGTVTAARVCVGGVSDVPHRSTAAEQALVGATWADDPSTLPIVAEAAAAAAAGVEPPSDTHGDAEFRRDLVRAMLVRSLAQGAARAAAAGRYSRD